MKETMNRVMKVCGKIVFFQNTYDSDENLKISNFTWFLK